MTKRRAERPNQFKVILKAVIIIAGIVLVATMMYFWYQLEVRRALIERALPAMSQSVRDLVAFRGTPQVLYSIDNQRYFLGSGDFALGLDSRVWNAVEAAHSYLATYPMTGETRREIDHIVFITNGDAAATGVELPEFTLQGPQVSVGIVNSWYFRSEMVNYTILLTLIQTICLSSFDFSETLDANCNEFSMNLAAGMVGYPEDFIINYDEGFVTGQMRDYQLLPDVYEFGLETGARIAGQP